MKNTFIIAQWLLLVVLGLLATMEMAKAVRHMHEIILALNGDDWVDNGWYFLSMGVGGAGALAAILGFAFLHWRHGWSYLAPFALLIGAAAAEFAFEEIGMIAGKLIAHPHDIQLLATYNWHQALVGLAIMTLCLFSAGHFSWRTTVKQPEND